MCVRRYTKGTHRSRSIWSVRGWNSSSEATSDRNRSLLVWLDLLVHGPSSQSMQASAIGVAVLISRATVLKCTWHHRRSTILERRGLAIPKAWWHVAEGTTSWRPAKVVELQTTRWKQTDAASIRATTMQLLKVGRLGKRLLSTRQLRTIFVGVPKLRTVRWPLKHDR